MFGFFSAPETPETKTFAQYYEDLDSAAESIRKEINNADNDPGFVKAAQVLADLVIISSLLEVVPAREAGDINKKRHKLQLTIGSDGIIDVTGEASKALAIKFNALTTDLLNKKYWPSEDCPTFFGLSFRSEYDRGFEHRKPGIEKAIATTAQRIANYDASLRPSMAM